MLVDDTLRISYVLAPVGVAVKIYVEEGLYQLALYVIFESGLQMLADNPTLYYRNEDCTRFIDVYKRQGRPVVAAPVQNRRYRQRPVRPHCP